jgi:hypothetical protein
MLDSVLKRRLMKLTWVGAPAGDVPSFVYDAGCWLLFVWIDLPRTRLIYLVCAYVLHSIHVL